MSDDALALLDSVVPVEELVALRLACAYTSLEAKDIAIAIPAIIRSFTKVFIMLI